MMTLFHRALIVFLIYTPAVFAQDIELPETKATLISELPLSSGQPTQIALRLSPKPGWHLYWKNYGDTGAETAIVWKNLPPSFKIGPVQYPAPERLPFLDLMNYGYNGPVTLLMSAAPLRAPAAPIMAEAQWLACTDKICVPESATLELKAATPAGGRLFANARAALPVTPALQGRFHKVSGQFQLAVAPPPPLPEGARVEFFPENAPLIIHAAPQVAVAQANGVWLEVQADNTGAAPAAVRGVLAVIAPDGRRLAYAVEAGADAQPIVAPPTASPLGRDPLMDRKLATVPQEQGLSLWPAIGFALLGGLILNVMPCVFPVLALKALALTRSGANESSARREALAYTGGALVTFGLIGGALLALRSGGAAIGWGFQLQNPLIVAALAALMVMIGLNLLGVFSIGGQLGGVGADQANQSGPKGAFWTGALAVIVATPCTAPFMASALGATLTLPPVGSLLVFLALGLGMAVPFLLLGFVPAVRQILPKPGKWTVTARKLLALPMFATALWLGSLLLPKTPPPPAQAFSSARLEALVKARKPVFVYFTADWCLSCKVNERVALDTPQTSKAFAKAGVHVLIADWTKRDEKIAKVLESYGRNGVPLYLYFKPGAPLSKPLILPQLLTPGVLEQAVKNG